MLVDDRYASHVKVLEALPSVLNIRRVLELGAGDHSTRVFLSMPGLEKLTSPEGPLGHGSQCSPAGE